MRAAINIASDLKALHLSEFDFTSFEPDPKIIQLEYASKQGEPCESIKSELSANANATQNAAFATLKRNSLAAMGNASKKRRNSKPSALGSPFLDDSLQSRSSITDPNFIRYHQLASQRRHSYAPLTSYQEQQFAWMNQQQNLTQSSLSPQFHLQPLSHISQSNTSIGIQQPPRLNISENYTPMVRSKLGVSNDVPKSASIAQNPMMYSQLPFQPLSENQMNMMLSNDMIQQPIFDPIPNQNTNFIDTSQSQGYMDQNSWQWTQEQ
jgi:hypothetical protein